MRLSTNTLLTVLAGAAMTSAQPGAAWSSTTSSAATSTASAASSSALGSGTPLNGKLTEFLAYSKNMTIQANGVIIDGDEGFSFGKALCLKSVSNRAKCGCQLSPLWAAESPLLDLAT